MLLSQFWKDVLNYQQSKICFSIRFLFLFLIVIHFIEDWAATTSMEQQEKEEQKDEKDIERWLERAQGKRCLLTLD